jgi:hypothetical protein
VNTRGRTNRRGKGKGEGWAEMSSRSVRVVGWKGGCVLGARGVRNGRQGEMA